MSHKDKLPVYLHRAYDIFLNELEHYYEHISQLSDLDKDHSTLLQHLHRLAGGAAFVKEDTMAHLAFDAEHIVEQILSLKASPTISLANTQEVETLTQKGKAILSALLAECDLIINRNSSTKFP